jgi:hypothetical protein
LNAFLGRKFKDILIYKIQDRPNNNTPTIHNSTAYLKTSKPFQEQYPPLNNYSLRKRARKKVKLITNYALRTNRPTRSSMKSDSTKEIVRILRISMRKLISCTVNLLSCLRTSRRMIDDVWNT